MLGLTPAFGTKPGWSSGQAPGNDPGCDLLWRYNLHHFDDLNAVDSPTWAAWHDALLQRWVAENLPGVGPGWEPYPTSLRIVNWIKMGAGRSRAAARVLAQPGGANPLAAPSTSSAG